MGARIGVWGDQLQQALATGAYHMNACVCYVSFMSLLSMVKDFNEVACDAWELRSTGGRCRIKT